MIRIEPVTFAKRLKDARLAAGLTQQQLADARHTSDRTVSAWETGTAEGILAENLFCIADKLNVNARWLALGQDREAHAMTALHEILRGLESLPIEQQEAVRILVLSLKK